MESSLSHHFIANLWLTASVKEFCKSVNF